VNTKSINFDGIDQYIEVPDPSDFHYESGGSDQPFSVIAHVKPTTITNFRMSIKGGSADREWAFRFTGTDNLLFIMNSTADGTGFIRRLGTVNLIGDQGAWHQYGGTYDGSGFQTGIKLYRDGSLTAGSTAIGGGYTAMRDSGANVRIASWEGLDFSNGIFNYVAVYNKELSSAEMSTIWNAGVPINLKKLQTSSDLELWLRGNRVSGTLALDASDNGHDSTLVNGPTIVGDVP
jgi:hypothetical protein